MSLSMGFEFTKLGARIVSPSLSTDEEMAFSYCLSIMSTTMLLLCSYHAFTVMIMGERSEMP